jgi:integrase
MKEQLSDAIEAYMRHRTSQNYSKGTLKVDRQVLTKFLAISGNIYCHQVTPRHIERHFEEVTKTRQAASLKNDHGVLRRFFEWCRGTGRIPINHDPMFGRRQPKAVKRERNRLPVTRFTELLEAAEERDPRDRALCALLLYTLGRDSEVTDLRIRDLDLQGGWLKVRIHKTGQEDTLPVSAELDKEMRRWLTHYGTVAGPLQPWFHLVPARGVFPVRSDSGQIVKHESVYRPEKKIGGAGRIVNPILDKIGFPVLDENGKPCGEGSHTIRRSGARALFDILVEGITADRRTRDDVIRGKMLYPSAVVDAHPIRAASGA